jgi:hypothetical protein
MRLVKLLAALGILATASLALSVPMAQVAQADECGDEGCESGDGGD